MSLPNWKNSKTCVVRVPEVFKDEVIAFVKDLDEGRVMPGQSIQVTAADMEESMMVVFKEELKRREHPRHVVTVQRILERFVSVLTQKTSNLINLKDLKMPLLQNKTLKVTMLGTVSSGKTCYMLGMYSEMVIGIAAGLTISSVDLDKGQLLLNQWEQLVSIEGVDRWPDATLDTEEYAFDFSYNLKPIMRFDWMDYRGGAMNDNSSVSDVKTLIDRLVSSDCTLLCVPAEALAEDYKPKTAAKFKIPKINNLVAKVAFEANPTEHNPYPIVIVVTQFDKIADTISEEQLINRTKRYFPGLFVKESVWDVAICPVSLGSELSDNPDSGEVDPLNLHLPVTFAVWHKLVKMRISSGIEKDSNKLWMKKVIDTWRDTFPSDALKDLEKKILIISEELENIPVFRGGEQLNGYDDI